NIKFFTSGLQELNLNIIGPRATSSFGVESPESGFGISDNTWWSSKDTLPQAVWYQFPIPVVVTKYSFRTRSDSFMVENGPSKYEIFGSNASDCSDQASWITLLQENSDKPFTSKNDPKSGYILNPKSFLCYGIKVINCPGNDRTSVSNIKFYT
ncbi:unnamed protein product, partial [Meganyctiphanes norvegica]